MKSSINLIFDLISESKFTISINGNDVTHTFDPSDEFNNSVVTVDMVLDNTNQINIHVENTTNEIVNLKEIIVDGIRFGLVTFLCTTADDQPCTTQLKSTGLITVSFDQPVWEFWCKKYNSFNYKDYPLGTAT